MAEAGAEAVEQVAFFLFCCMSLAQCHGDQRPQQQPRPTQSKGGSLDKSQLQGQGKGDVTGSLEMLVGRWGGVCEPDPAH